MNLMASDIPGRLPAEQGELERFASENDFPLVEGNEATFLYQGHADEVHLHHRIYALASTSAFTRIEGTDFWTLTMEMPATSRVEYKLDIVHGDQHRLIEDPLNPNHSRDPFGRNSVVFGEGYEEPEWAQQHADTRPGRVVEHVLHSDAFQGRRPFSVYLPARFRETRRYPLLVVHDGEEFLHFAALKNVLDNMIHRLEIPPMIVALTQSPDRLNEYPDNEAHAKFLVEELVPGLEDLYPLVGTPDTRALMGSSFGAIASLSAAWRNPGFFSTLILHSGSFAFTDIGFEHEKGPLFDPVVTFMNAFRANPGKPVDRVYVSCGIYEPMIYYNRSMVPLLEQTGMEVRYTEARDGHNWENWRDRLREALSWSFPGPLWRVYE